MAERRMFAKTIVTSDAFLDMPPTARCLYFTLGMFADDDGFVNNPKSIMRQVGATTDDMNILITKRFVLIFESGVIVIKHWRIHNYIRGDRKHETKYVEELNTLNIDENGAYTLSEVDDVALLCQSNDRQVSDNCHTEVRLGKDRLVEDSKEKLNMSKLTEEFEELWAIYPKKQGKQNALKAYAKARKDGVKFEDVVQGIREYSKYVKDKDPQYIRMGSTFFNQRSWQDDWSINGYSRSNGHDYDGNEDSFGEKPQGWDNIFR